MAHFALLSQFLRLFVDHHGLPEKSFVFAQAVLLLGNFFLKAIYTFLVIFHLFLELLGTLKLTRVLLLQLMSHVVSVALVEEQVLDADLTQLEKFDQVLVAQYFKIAFGQLCHGDIGEQSFKSLDVSINDDFMIDVC